MAVKKFYSGVTYRHRNPHCTMDMTVLKVRYVDEKRSKLRVEFPHRNNGRIQYTGKGQYGLTDEVTIWAKDYNNWSVLSETDPKGETGPDAAELILIEQLRKES